MAVQQLEQQERERHILSLQLDRAASKLYTRLFAGLFGAVLREDIIPDAYWDICEEQGVFSDSPLPPEQLRGMIEEYISPIQRAHNAMAKRSKDTLTPIAPDSNPGNMDNTDTNKDTEVTGNERMTGSGQRFALLSNLPSPCSSDSDSDTDTSGGAGGIAQYLASSVGTGAGTGSGDTQAPSTPFVDSIGTTVVDGCAGGDYDNGPMGPNSPMQKALRSLDRTLSELSRKHKYAPVTVEKNGNGDAPSAGEDTDAHGETDVSTTSGISENKCLESLPGVVQVGSNEKVLEGNTVTSFRIKPRSRQQVLRSLKTGEVLKLKAMLNYRRDNEAQLGALARQFRTAADLRIKEMDSTEGRQISGQYNAGSTTRSRSRSSTSAESDESDTDSDSYPVQGPGNVSSSSLLQEDQTQTTDLRTDIGVTENVASLTTHTNTTGAPSGWRARIRRPPQALTNIVLSQSQPQPSATSSTSDIATASRRAVIEEIASPNWIPITSMGRTPTQGDELTEEHKGYDGNGSDSEGHMWTVKGTVLSHDFELTEDELEHVIQGVVTVNSLASMNYRVGDLGPDSPSDDDSGCGRGCDYDYKDSSERHYYDEDLTHSLVLELGSPGQLLAQHVAAASLEVEHESKTCGEEGGKEQNEDDVPVEMVTAGPVVSPATLVDYTASTDSNSQSSLQCQSLASRTPELGAIMRHMDEVAAISARLIRINPRFRLSPSSPPSIEKGKYGKYEEEKEEGENENDMTTTMKEEHEEEQQQEKEVIREDTEKEVEQAETVHETVRGGDIGANDSYRNRPREVFKSRLDLMLELEMQLEAQTRQQQQVSPLGVRVNAVGGFEDNGDEAMALWSPADARAHQYMPHLSALESMGSETRRDELLDDEVEQNTAISAVTAESSYDAYANNDARGLNKSGTEITDHAVSEESHHGESQDGDLGNTFLEVSSHTAASRARRELSESTQEAKIALVALHDTPVVVDLTSSDSAAATPRPATAPLDRPAPISVEELLLRTKKKTTMAQEPSKSEDMGSDLKMALANIRSPVSDSDSDSDSGDDDDDDDVVGALNLVKLGADGLGETCVIPNETWEAESALLDTSGRSTASNHSFGMDDVYDDISSTPLVHGFNPHADSLEPAAGSTTSTSKLTLSEKFEKISPGSSLRRSLPGSTSVQRGHTRERSSLPTSTARKQQQQQQQVLQQKQHNTPSPHQHDVYLLANFLANPTPTLSSPLMQSTPTATTLAPAAPAAPAQSLLDDIWKGIDDMY